MKVSVIIPVYNAGALIDRCLDSVFAQDAECELEVILVDDGSSDESVQIIESRPEQDRILLLRQANAGPSVARNRGLSAATGDFVAFIDADDYWLPGFISATLRFLQQNMDAVAVSVAQRHITVSGEHESPVGWRGLAPLGGVLLEDFYEFWADHNHVCTGSIMIRADIAKATGGMRPDMRVCEDLEFWALLATKGRIGFIPEILFVSDGGKVTEEIGRVEKNLPRWRNAVSVEEWQKRIVEALPGELPSGFVKARGRIASNLTYCIMLSGRYKLARRQVCEYGSDFPAGKMSKLLRLGAVTAPFWFVVSRVLRWREYHR